MADLEDDADGSGRVLTPPPPGAGDAPDAAFGADGSASAMDSSEGRVVAANYDTQRLSWNAMHTKVRAWL